MNLAQSKATRTVTGVAATHRRTAQDKMAHALTRASSQAKKQLVSHGLKLPTQSWTGSTIRKPAVWVAGISNSIKSTR
jgi:hypothetical protein